jgi:phage shock protein PspC (stress-responsive transcriptional regulator)
MKKLYRSRRNRMIGGVCGGIAEYFDIDPVIVRIIAVAFFFMGGSALLAYVLGLIVIPNEPFAQPAAEKQEKTLVTVPAATPAVKSSSEAVPLILGIILIFIGVVFLLHNIPLFSPFYWRALHIVRHFFWPSLLIVSGIFIIVRGWKR